ncbi:MAG TPA: YadA-like family protein [Gallionella sp.]|nr:YadA-like family protein [Gallionella sp.]
MNETYRSIRKAASGMPVATAETGKAKRQRRGSAILAGTVAAVTLVGAPGTAQAALVSVCTGVSLPPSTITTMLNPLVTPLATALPLLGLGPIWTGIAAGAPVRLNVLDTAGNPVLSTAVCDATADSYALNTPKGISIGGNKITGLGITTVANAGETGSIALGNGATTNAAATNSIALGTNASVGAAGANSVALGAGSAANTGAQVAYAAFGLATPRTSVGEVSVGATGSLRKITNLAPGSALTDAVNVEQLQAVDNLAVKYDSGLKLSVTLGGAGGTTIHNVAPGVLPTDAVNVNQLQTIATTPTKYFHANSTGADSLANGAESISIGPRSLASATNSIAAGNGATASAVNSVALGSNSIADRANTVSVGSPGAERQITNVGDATAPTDAVNLRQLNAAIGQTNQDIAKTQRDANAGTAAALAASTLPQATMAGKSMAVAGVATYQGQSALAVGISSLSDNGRWIVRFNGSTTTRGNVGVGAGVGFYF